jgi:Acyl-coenzyme A:6-aminopenicillanic acid acyl-transferase
VSKDGGGGRRVATPGSWPDWRRWVDGVDWPDWRAWPQRAAPAGWAAGRWAAPPWEQPPAGEIPLTVRAFAEDEPGDRIRGHLALSWPAFRQWWRDGANTRPAAALARARLEEHMPELVPAWQRLTAMIGGPGADAGAALALRNPPPFLTGCSQAVVPDGGPALIRNYDWDYRLFDAVVARMAYAGRPVLGPLDGLWGLLDGVNDAGLAVSLTSGGRPQAGEGFGIPLLIRYVLESCAAPSRPCGCCAGSRSACPPTSPRRTRPGNGPRRTWPRTGRPGPPAWPRSPTTRARRNGSPTPRRSAAPSGWSGLKQLLAGRADAAGVVDACPRPPPYATRFHDGFGTLYTAEYRPAEGAVRCHWPGRTWAQSLDTLRPGQHPDPVRHPVTRPPGRARWEREATAVRNNEHAERSGLHLPRPPTAPAGRRQPGRVRSGGA